MKICVVNVVMSPLQSGCKYLINELENRCGKNVMKYLLNNYYYFRKLVCTITAYTFGKNSDDYKNN